MCLILLTRGFLITRAGFFICYSIITELPSSITYVVNFDVTRTIFLPSKFPHFQTFRKALIRGIFGRSNRPLKNNFLAIFLQHDILRKMSYLYSKDHFSMISGLPPRAL